MSKINDGGPAFGQVVDMHCVHVDPCGATEWEPAIGTSGGLTVRDYFAAKAMPPLLAQCDCFPDENWRHGVALDAYKMADAMLAARGAA